LMNSIATVSSLKPQASGWYKLFEKEHFKHEQDARP